LASGSPSFHPSPSPRPPLPVPAPSPTPYPAPALAPAPGNAPPPSSPLPPLYTRVRMAPEPCPPPPPPSLGRTQGDLLRFPRGLYSHWGVCLGTGEQLLAAAALPPALRAPGLLLPTTCYVGHLTAASGAQW